MESAILDTDILSEVLKGRNLAVRERARQYLAEHHRLAYSSLTVYEIIRGLRAANADRQIQQFLALAATSDVLQIEMSVLLRAADLWVDATKGGYPRNDADLIIAATALTADRILVTGNTQHFSWIAGLRMDDWRKA